MFGRNQKAGKLETAVGEDLTRPLNQGELYRQVTNGNVTTGYNADLESFGAVVQVKDIIPGVDVKYVTKKSNFGDSEDLSVTHQGIQWWILSSKIAGIQLGLNGYFPSGNMAPEDVRGYEATHDETPERIQKAQKVFDYFVQKIKKLPVTDSCIKGLNSFIKARKLQEKQQKKQREKEEQSQKAELERKYKDSPDPFDRIVALVPK